MRTATATGRLTAWQDAPVERRTRRRLAWGTVVLAVVAAALAVWLALRPRAEGTPVVFVHGMGASAAAIGTEGGPFGGLLPRLADRQPAPGVCQRDAQPGRRWQGSPCVFRYAEDVATGGDSQSGVEANARKLAGEVAEVHANAGRRVVLVGYSMGGMIVRTYLALHPEAAEDQVAGVVLLHPATSGSWAHVLDLRERFDNPAVAFLIDAVTDVAADRVRIDLERPAARDLRPGSELYRRLARLPLPRNLRYTTFWGDVRLVFRALPAELGLPEASVALGDLWLAPGDPDPAALPRLGGQRLRPPTNPPGEALEVPHTREIEVSVATAAEIAGACVLDPSFRCLAVLRGFLDVPNAHWRIPFTIGEIRIDHPAFGDVTLEDAVVAAVARAGER